MRSLLTTLAELAGGALIVAGVARVAGVGAALIVAGVALVAVGVRQAP